MNLNIRNLELVFHLSDKDAKLVNINKMTNRHKKLSFLVKNICRFIKIHYLCNPKTKRDKFLQIFAREHSSVGSERLPYKQRVGGSTPSAPTKK